MLCSRAWRYLLTLSRWAAKFQGVDLSNPIEPINYDGMHPGSNPAFTQEQGFVTYHTSLASSNGPQNQGL
ncbi:unnamed protein product [Urochloa humidicola]